MFVILLQAKIVPLVDKSPLWFTIVNEQRCKDYWWTNLLYMNNFHPSNTFQDSVKIRIKCCFIIISNTMTWGKLVIKCPRKPREDLFPIVSIFLLSPFYICNKYFITLVSSMDLVSRYWLAVFRHHSAYDLAYFQVIFIRGYKNRDCKLLLEICEPFIHRLYS